MHCVGFVFFFRLVVGFVMSWFLGGLGGGGVFCPLMMMVLLWSVGRSVLLRDDESSRLEIF